MKKSPGILPMRPKLVAKVWGGRRLGDVFGKPIGEGSWGESWEVADLVEGESIVASGPHASKSLGEVRAEFGASLVGTRSPTSRFPLLVKVLDAARDLSVQVHPGEDDLERFEGAQSKDESWLILESDSGAILHGCRAGVSSADWEEAVRRRDPVPLLRRVRVQRDDVFRVSPGCVHAILGGTALLEIQQPSDTTFRVFDYERPGLDGKPRELHVDEALEVSVVEEVELRPAPSRFRAGDTEVSVLVDVDAYRIERLEIEDALSWSIDPGSPQVIFVTRGEVVLGDVQLDTYETAIIPAAEGQVQAVGRADLVVAGLGGRRLVDA